MRVGRSSGIRAAMLAVGALAPAQELPPSLAELRRTPVQVASRLSQDPRWAPAKVVVLTGEDLRRRGYLDLDEVLHDLAGFDFERGFGSHWTQIYMRGQRSTNSDRFLFLWDGVIQNDIWAQVAWLERQFPLSAIERIEIMYGPASLLYGSNALSGIVSITTRAEAQRLGTTVQARGGSFHTRAAEVSTYQELRGWRFGFSGRYLETWNRDLTDETWTDAGGRTRYYGLQFPRDYDLAALAVNGGTDRAGVFHTEYEPATGRLWAMKNGFWSPFTGRYGRKDPAWWFVEGSVGFGAWDLRAMSWIRRDSEDGWTTPQALIGASWNSGAESLQLTHHAEWGAWSSKASLLMRTSTLEPDTEEPDFGRDRPWDPAGGPLPKVNRLGPYIQYKLFNREYRALEQIAYKGGALEGVIGAELTAARVYENYYTRLTDLEPWNFKPQHDERNAGLFLNIQDQVREDLALSVGLRYDHNWEAGGPGGFGDLVTSRVAILFAPRPDQILKVTAGQAFQAPEPFKKYSTNPSRSRPSPDLKPERLQSLEVGWGLDLFPAWRLDVNGFLSLVDQQIVLVPVAGSPGDNRFENRGRLRIHGGEAELRRYLDRANSLYLNVSANRARDLEQRRDPGGIAPLQAQFGADLLFRDRWSLSLKGRWISARKTARHDDPSLLIVRDVDPYLTVDLALGWRDFLPGLELRLDLLNVGNARYYDPGVRSADGTYYNGAVLQQPFRGFIGVIYRF